MDSKNFNEVKEYNVDDEINEFERMTENAAQVQKDALRKILEQNCNAEYLRAFGLQGRTDIESFKACIPIVTHEDLEPYIQRIVDGDDSPILRNTPIRALSLSTGTTQGRSKFLPFTEEMMDATVQVYRTSFAFTNREYPVKDGKALQFIYASKHTTTSSGLIATTGTTNIYLSEKFKTTMKETKSECCSPDEVIFCPVYDQSVYCHLLCALIYSQDVHIVSSPFAFNIVHALRTFEQVWVELCEDIRAGVLSAKITVPSVRKAVSEILKPNPKLADSIYSKCKDLCNWYSLIPTIWPNTKYVSGIMTGSMESYVKKLRHYAGDLPLISPYYGASEGWIGANVNPRLELESVSYAVLPNINYFEFLPLKENPEEEEEEEHESNGSITKKIGVETVELTEVEVGKLYEVILTTFSGLYRYRLGDIVKVSSFHNSTPELQFVCRLNNLLSINIDKNTEKDILLAIDQASQALAVEKLEVVDYTSQADTSSEPGHYVMFLELSGDADEEILSRCCNCLDLAFIESAYVRSRVNGMIGPLELRVVRRGTFQKILDHHVKKGTTMNQFKMPRCVGPSRGDILQILCSNVVKRCFSTAYA